MPNHVATQFIVSGPKSDVERFLETAKSAESNIDHNRLFPMPDELRDTTSPVRIMTQQEIDKMWSDWRTAKEAKANTGPMGLHSFDEDRPFGLGITQSKHDELVSKYGASNWYDWSIANWGTKWGLYDVSSQRDIPMENPRSGYISVGFSYNTAWSPATQFWLKVSADYPTLVFYHGYADEGGGFVGSESIVDGQVIECEDVDWSSDQGIEIRQMVGCYHDEDTE